MKYFFLLIPLIIKSIFSDEKAGQRELEKLEKRAKALACSFLSNSFVSSVKDYDKKLKELLKENKFIQNESEAKDKISQFMLVNCYLKITSDIANKLLLEIPKKNVDLTKKKQFLELFEMDKNTDFSKIAETMKEINEIMKEIKAEEEIFSKKRKEDPNFEKNLKDFEEKMKKNYENKKSEKTKSNNVKNTKKKKGNGKKPYEGTKWEFVESSEEDLLHFKDIIINPKKFFEVTGLNTICGMIIMTLLLINFIQIGKNILNKKEEKKQNEEDINEIIKENNENEEEEDEKEEENNNNLKNEKEKENINNEINKILKQKEEKDKMD